MNEVPHPGFDKPEEYETFTTTNDLEEAAEEYIKKGKYLPEAFVVRPAFKAGAELIIAELFKKLNITPLRVIGKDEHNYPIYDFEVGHYYQTFKFLGNRYKCDQTTSGQAGADLQKAKDEETIKTAEDHAFLAGADWQKEQFEKNRLANCDKLTKEEYDRETDFAMEIIEKEHRQPTFTDAINYGMRVMKEQMIKEAVEGEVGNSCFGIVFLRKNLTNDGYSTGDKVRIIVLPKED